MLRFQTYWLGTVILPAAAVLSVANVVQRGFKVVALTRKPEKTQQLFNNHPNLEVNDYLVTESVTERWCCKVHP